MKASLIASAEAFQVSFGHRLRMIYKPSQIVEQMIAMHACEDVPSIARRACKIHSFKQ
jgi:hypothetical protein